MAITAGYNGKIEFIEESSYGTTPATGQLDIPSDAVIRSNLQLHREVKRHYGITSHSAVDTTYHTKQYTLTFEYEVQQLKTSGEYHVDDHCIEYYSNYRDANGDLQGLTFFYDCNGGAYRLYGGLVNKYSWDCTQDNAIHATVEVIGIGWEAADTLGNLSTYTTYGDLTGYSAIGETIETYEGSAITRSGVWGEGIKTGNFSIDNQCERLYKAGASEAQSIKPQYENIEGSCLVYASDGGHEEADDLLDGEEVNIVFASGATSNQSHQFTFSNGAYTDVPLLYEVNMTGMTLDIKWGAEGVAYAAVS